jgi:uncharacterized membrane protein
MSIATSNRAKIATVMLSALAAGLAGLLLYQSQTQEVLPGCGGGSGCDAVLSSRWSLWLGIPVSMMALMVYTAMFVAVIMRDPGVKQPQHPANIAMTVCAFSAIASALWFVGVQVFAVGALCKYCIATHTAGVAASVLCLMVALPLLPTKYLASSSGGAVLLVGALIAGQVLGKGPQAPAPKIQYATDQSAEPDLPDVLPPVPKNPLLADPSRTPLSTPPKPAPSTDENKASAKQQEAAAPAPQPVSLYGGRLKLDAADVPRIGNLDARDLLVILYDYTCSHCRHTRTMLERTTKRHGDNLAILCLPTPLSRKCNRLIKRDNPTNRYACDLAQISLAVWKAAPDKWVEFDRKIYTDDDIRTPVRARSVAKRLVGEEELAKALKDPWIDQQIQRNVSMYATAARAAGSSALPMLITKKGVMNGTPGHILDIDDLIKGKQRQ